MIKIGQHIQFLLTRHDCVIVPGWGAFIAHYTPAQLPEGDSLLLPPSKTITFNPALTHNDGMLATSIMRRHRISYETACRTIDDEVDTMKHALSVTREIAIDGIGLFTAVDGGTPHFEPVAANIAIARYTALPQLPAITIMERARVEATPADEPAKPTFSRFKYAALRAIASVAVIICVVSALMVPIGPQQRSIISIASIGSAIVESTPAEETVADEVVATKGNLFVALPAAGSHSYLDTTARNNYRAVIQYNAEKIKRKAERRTQPNLNTAEMIAKSKKASEARRAVKADAAVAKADAPKTPMLSLDESSPYCLVVSSHASRAEADKYIAAHSATPMKVLEKDGKYRVYIASGSSSSQVRSAINSSVRKSYPGAWVCSRYE